MILISGLLCQHIKHPLYLNLILFLFRLLTSPIKIHTLVHANIPFRLFFMHVFLLNASLSVVRPCALIRMHHLLDVSLLLAPEPLAQPLIYHIVTQGLSVVVVFPLWRLRCRLPLRAHLIEVKRGDLLRVKFPCTIIAIETYSLH
jgi:hypothetical protein